MNKLKLIQMFETLFIGYFIFYFINKSKKYITGIEIEHKNLLGNPDYLKTRKPYQWTKFTLHRRR